MSEEFNVLLPKLGESIMNATVVQWFKKEGEVVSKDEPLLEVATDKVNSEIPSPFPGILKKIHARENQELSVGDLLATISQSGQGDLGASQQGSGEKSPAIEQSSVPLEANSMQDYYSPALLRLAREMQVSLEELGGIEGTGDGGRITKKDLENYGKKKKEPCPLAPSDGVEHIKMSGMRKAIADNMVRSFYGAPHASLVCEVDVTGVMETVDKEKERFFSLHGAKLTVTSFVARAIAKGLKEYPLLNASLQEDTIVVKHFINLGIAVSVDQGIMVPVIRGCHRLDLSDIAKELGQLAQKARAGALTPNDIGQGTITLTNFGMSGVQIGIPIIRYGEVAIVGLGAITKKIVVLQDDQFGVRQMMHISLTFDHRIIDGMYGCGFLAAVKGHVEEDLSC